MRNLCHFDLVIAGVLYPAADPALVLDPILSPRAYPIGGCLVRDLYGFNAPDVLLDLPEDEDGRVVVPRLAPAIALARAAGLNPYTIPQHLIGQRGRPGPVTLGSEDALEPAPDWLEVEYGRLADVPLEELAGGLISRHVKDGFPIRVAGGPTFAPIEDELAAIDHPDGSATCPAPEDEAVVAVIVPHSGPIVREYASMGYVVLVTSVVRQDGTVDLYRVA